MSREKAANTKVWCWTALFFPKKSGWTRRRLPCKTKTPDDMTSKKRFLFRKNINIRKRHPITDFQPSFIRRERIDFEYERRRCRRSKTGAMDFFTRRNIFRNSNNLFLGIDPNDIQRKPHVFHPKQPGLIWNRKHKQHRMVGGQRRSIHQTAFPGQRGCRYFRVKTAFRFKTHGKSLGCGRSE